MKMPAEQFPLKVAFTGAGCVGKTALLDTVAGQCKSPSIGIVGEAARDYFVRRPELPEFRRYHRDHQENIQRMVMRREEMAFDLDIDYIFCDRSVFDAAVCVSSTGDAAGAKLLLKRAMAWIPGNSEVAYSQLYVLDPADVPFENDPVRTEDPETRWRQHETFLDFFTSNGIAHELLSGTVDQRTDIVLSNLPVIDLKPV